MVEVSIPEKDKRTYILSREQLYDLYNVLVYGNDHPKNTEFVMFFSDPSNNSISAMDVDEGFFILVLNDSIVGRIVKFAQSAQYEGNIEGPYLSDFVRTSLTKGRKSI